MIDKQYTKVLSERLTQALSIILHSSRLRLTNATVVLEKFVPVTIPLQCP